METYAKCTRLQTHGKAQPKTTNFLHGKNELRQMELEPATYTIVHALYVHVQCTLQVQCTCTLITPAHSLILRLVTLFIRGETPFALHKL